MGERGPGNAAQDRGKEAEWQDGVGFGVCRKRQEHGNMVDELGYAEFQGAGPEIWDMGGQKVQVSGRGRVLGFWDLGVQGCAPEPFQRSVQGYEPQESTPRGVAPMILVRFPRGGVLTLSA